MDDLSGSAGYAMAAYFTIAVVYYAIAKFHVHSTIFGLLHGLAGMVFNNEVVVVVMTVFLVIYRGYVNDRLFYYVLFLLLVILFIRVSTGGAAPVVIMGIPIMIAVLTVRYNLSFKIGRVITLFVLIAMTSVIGTYMKFSEHLPGNKGVFDVTIDDLRLIKIDQVIGYAGARAGFLDFSTEIIARSDEYKRIINLERYGEAIVDGLTPGFNIYDTPVSGFSLRAVYMDSFPSDVGFSDIVTNYQSDQINISTEAYLLFGVLGGLVYMYLIAYFFSNVILRLSLARKMPFLRMAVASMISFLFWVINRSFGMDHFIVITLFPLFISIISSLLIVLMFKYIVFDSRTVDAKGGGC